MWPPFWPYPSKNWNQKLLDTRINKQNWNNCWNLNNNQPYHINTTGTIRAKETLLLLIIPLAFSSHVSCLSPHYYCQIKAKGLYLTVVSIKEKTNKKKQKTPALLSDCSISCPFWQCQHISRSQQLTWVSAM